MCAKGNYVGEAESYIIKDRCWFAWMNSSCIQMKFLTGILKLLWIFVKCCINDKSKLLIHITTYVCEILVNKLVSKMFSESIEYISIKCESIYNL